MDKVKILAEFEAMLKRKFPGRQKPITAKAEYLEKATFDDLRFSQWRKRR